MRAEILLLLQTAAVGIVLVEGQFTLQQSYSQCSKCLSDPFKKFCFDGKSNYFCCSTVKPRKHALTQLRGDNQTILEDFCDPSYQCSNSDYTQSMTKYQFCPSDKQICKNEKPLEMYSSFPFHSNAHKTISLNRLPENYVCNYEIDLLYNEEFDDMMHLTVQNHEDVKVGISYQNKANGGNSIREIGLVSEVNCIQQSNCTKDTSGYLNYYLSNSDKAFVTVISLENSKNTQFQLEAVVASKNSSVMFFLIQTFVIWIIFLIYFKIFIRFIQDQHKEWYERKSKEEQEEVQEAKRLKEIIDF
ncbi:UNKNOWN [Stylonychia lemnae]|uniref:Transmembrane protein n=1 Tax=Stylonychia lemnae TaxID=5949 RepID=A0A078BBW3_STYLE|nr:UNKNOWN [Stylonychia lemnae]|eukprot:CDW90742.1 UNKNOWN [Stylonychia lemnae]